MFQSMNRFLAAVLFFALSMSCMPMAFASEDNPSVQSDPSALATEVPTINVTVPTSFVLGGDAGIDIQELGDVSASSQFVNSSNVPVRIKEIHCNASGLNNYFDVKGANKATFSLLGKNIGWAPTAAADTAIYEVSAEGSEEFILPINAKENTTLSLAMLGMEPKNAVVEATKDRKALRNLMKLSWTFEMVAPSGAEEPGDGEWLMPNGSTDDDFYLEIPENAEEKLLSEHAGVYSLDNVVTMAEDISANAGGSIYYPMFHAMVGGASEMYIMQVKWGDINHDVRVIGINHDDRSKGNSKAGLTFQFKNLLNAGGVHTMEPPDEVGYGWGNSSLYRWMNPQQDYSSLWEEIIPSSQLNAFKSVTKKGSFFTGNHEISDLVHAEYTENKLFIASPVEIVGKWINDAVDDIDKEQVQYEYWRNRSTYFSPEHLRKSRQGDARPTSWWLRTPSRNKCFFSIDANGDLVASDYLNFYDVCPCFCL